MLLILPVYLRDRREERWKKERKKERVLLNFEFPGTDRFIAAFAKTCSYARGIDALVQRDAIELDFPTPGLRGCTCRNSKGERRCPLGAVSRISTPGIAYGSPAETRSTLFTDFQSFLSSSSSLLPVSCFFFVSLARKVTNFHCDRIHFVKIHFVCIFD